MIRLTAETRLTDELERQLMMQAIEEQFRPKPLQALKRLLSRLKISAPAGSSTAGSDYSVAR